MLQGSRGHTSRRKHVWQSSGVSALAVLGGALVTRHNGQEITYDWSSPADDPVRSIQWAAFFSDVEHEILPVTEGYRVTLTYNLYHSTALSVLPAVDVTTSPFHSNLEAALKHPHFLQEGGVLGFLCQHAYVFEKSSITWEEVLDVIQELPVERSTLITLLQKQGRYADVINKQEKKYADFKAGLDDVLGNEKSECFTTKVNEAVERIRCQRLSLKAPLLKGSDRTVLQAAQALNLEVELKPIVSKEEYFVGDMFKFESVFLVDDDLPWKDYLKRKGLSNASHIKWCQKSSNIWQPAIAAHILVGNICEPEICYQAAAILVSVPSWGDRCVQK